MKFSGGTVNRDRPSTVTYNHATFSGSRISYSGAKFTDDRVDYNETEFSGCTVSYNGAEPQKGQDSPRIPSEPIRANDDNHTPPTPLALPII